MTACAGGTRKPIDISFRPWRSSGNGVVSLIDDFADAHHDRHAGAVNVGVQQADARTGLRQGEGEVGGHGRFADAALAAGDGDERCECSAGRFSAADLREAA